jgi:undecaprenyl-diphosphatase
MVAATSNATLSVVLFVACAAAIVVTGFALARRPGRSGGRDDGPWVPRPLRGRGPLTTGVARLAILGVIVAAGLLLVLAIGAAVGFLARTSPIEHVNQGVLNWFVGHRGGWFDGFMTWLTGIGSSKHVIFPLAVIVGLAFSLWYDNPLPMILFTAGVVGAKTLQHYLIQIVHGSFPPAPTSIGPAGSYPSGGTIRVVVLFGLAAFLYSVRRPRRRGVTIALFTVVALLVFGEGFSRLYLGRHWLWDVVGGLVVGGLWLGVLGFGTVLLYRFDRRPRGRPPMGDSRPVEVHEPADGARV